VDTLNVELGSRSYPILIDAGLIARPEVYEALGARDVLIVSNTTVAPLYLRPLRAGLGARRALEVILPDGEAHKTLANAARVLDVLIANRFGRDCAVLALGGGVVGDLAGFVAACYQRGVAFVQVPTTLLAQVDSAVGGKTAVNHPGGKNLIGAFHQPQLVLSDTSRASDAARGASCAPAAEVIGTASSARWRCFLPGPRRTVAPRARDRRPSTRHPPLVRDQGGRHAWPNERNMANALLNLGHTFGHRAESATLYGVAHGGRWPGLLRRRCRASAACWSPGTPSAYGASWNSPGCPAGSTR
jgi:3-dehydroquinate synthase